MRHPPPLRHGELRRADIEMPEDLQGIAIDDLARERLGQNQRQLTLSRSGRTRHCNQRTLACILSSRWWSRLVHLAVPMSKYR